MADRVAAAIEFDIHQFNAEHIQDGPDGLIVLGKMIRDFASREISEFHKYRDLPC
jgi:hypothetical protein